MQAFTSIFRPPPRTPARVDLRTPRPLAEDDVPEVLEFLGRRPIHTSGLAGFIVANGLDSSNNRGTFYGCRGREGQLVGVALIGHATLFESRSAKALAGFARLARQAPEVHMILGEHTQVETFWRHYYLEGGLEPLAPRHFCRELLLALRWPIPSVEPEADLRLATVEELDMIVPVHAQTALQESGIDPLEVDPIGFRQRCSRRIEQGRTWVVVENGSLLFKAEVLTDTPSVTYLEGVWVNPDERGKGIGLRCMSQLSRILLAGSRSISLFVNRKNMPAQAFYKRAGFRLVSFFDTIFLE